jgi:hypothetical protein
MEPARGGEGGAHWCIPSIQRAMATIITFSVSETMVAGALNWVSIPVALFIGTVGAVSVFKAVYVDKRGIQRAMATIITFSVSETNPSGTLLDPPTQAHLMSRLSTSSAPASAGRARCRSGSSR